jgi:hypothetical protein
VHAQTAVETGVGEFDSGECAVGDFAGPWYLIAALMSLTQGHSSGVAKAVEGQSYGFPLASNSFRIHLNSFRFTWSLF